MSSAIDMYMQLFQYVRQHKVIWLLFVAFCLLGLWNLRSSSAFLETTCLSLDHHSVEHRDCGTDNYRYRYDEKGIFSDSSGDVFLLPTRLLYIPLANQTNLFEVVEIGSIFSILRNTFYVPEHAETRFHYITYAIILLQLVYFFVLALIVYWGWNGKKSWSEDISDTVKIIIMLFVINWLIPVLSWLILPFALFPVPLLIFFVIQSLVRKRFKQI